MSNKEVSVSKKNTKINQIYIPNKLVMEKDLVKKLIKSPKKTNQLKRKKDTIPRS